MEKILRLFYGYLTVMIRGEQLERFLNLCRSRGISLERIRYMQEEQIMAQMSARDFFLLRPVRNKTRVHIQIKRKRGLPFFFFRNKKRKAFFAGILLGSILLLGMTGRIWNIHIEGNSINSTTQILDFLGEQGVTHAMSKRKVNCSEVAAAVRREFPEITWVSARVEGTRLILEIKEGIPESEENSESGEKKNSGSQKKTENQKKQEKSCDLSAEHAGVITQMIVRSGIPVKKVGESCKAGEILVSGEIPVMNDNQEVVRYEYVDADADIFISRSVDYYQEVPLKYETQEATGEKKDRLFIRAGAWYLGLYEKKSEEWRMICEEEPFYLTENFRLPFSVGKVQMVKYRSVTGTYTEEEARKKAAVLFEQYEKRLLKRGISIAENHVTATMTRTSCINKGTLKIIEKTGTEVEPERNSIERNEQ